MKLGFIGTGTITSAVVKGILKSKIKYKKINISKRNSNKSRILKKLNQNEAGNIEFNIPLIKTNKIKNDLIFYILLITYSLIFLFYKNKNAKK